ncbi:MAG: hypothetical protein BECKG1743D_GA0114223_109852 [Candidatus Kentron sp. G]|nr:MAG: hypothetical protein BECKG1743F_GA0114225_109502 [Candidatus Kentron sp. G]VFN06310.1 MAG: hypothetical protein BECKG1743E_GA0114224_109972 [Candidatus Kentron sp. G]VFN07115.1 MAG: hypothetical protein BECKG1743D_GA0114223_109852 [Candidatus Kentron sp. G]
MLNHRLGAALNLEQALGIFLDRLLPLTHLDRVHSILLSDFVDRLHSLQGLKPNLGLVLRTVDLAFFLYCSRVLLKLLSCIWGPL